MSRLLAAAYGVVIGVVFSWLILFWLSVRSWRSQRRLRYDPHRSRE